MMSTISTGAPLVRAITPLTVLDMPLSSDLFWPANSSARSSGAPRSRKVHTLGWVAELKATPQLAPSVSPTDLEQPARPLPEGSPSPVVPAALTDSARRARATANPAFASATRGELRATPGRQLRRRSARRNDHRHRHAARAGQ